MKILRKFAVFCGALALFQVHAYATTPPNMVVLAYLSQDVYSPTEDVHGAFIAGSWMHGLEGQSFSYVQNPYNIYGVEMPPGDTIGTAGSTPPLTAIKAPVAPAVINLYRNDADAHQYAVAVRGTYSTYDVIADGSFLTDGVANLQLKKDVVELSKIVAAVRRQDPLANITLTGHSVGGAIVQMVGKVAGLNTVSFNSPGVGNIYDTVKDSIAVNFGQTTSTQLPTQPSITNFRVYGDQISMVGQQLDGVVTRTLDNPLPTAEADKVSTLLPMGWLNNHKILTVIDQLSSTCEYDTYNRDTLVCSGITTEQGTSFAGTNIAGLIINGLDGVSTANCLLSALTLLSPEGAAICMFASKVNTRTYAQNVLAALADMFLDPGPGYTYSLENAPGSPSIASLQLPLSDSVYGWSVLYRDEFGWESPLTFTDDSSFMFSSKVDALSFTPLDAEGNPTYNPDPFLYGISFADVGVFNATQGTFDAAEVPEPPTLPTFALALIACLLVVRFRRIGLYEAADLIRSMTTKIQ